MNRPMPIAVLLLLFVPAAPAAEPPARVSNALRPCSMDAMPAGDKQRLIAEHLRRQRADGKASADAWAREQGHIFRRRLVAEGVCPPLPPRAERRVAQNARPSGKAQLRNKQGKPCTNIRVENQVFPNFGGAPMTMGLVTVCAD